MVDGCPRPHHAHDLCAMHYRRQRHNQPLDMHPLPKTGRRLSPTPPCCVCDQPEPDSIGECGACRRPYRPALEGIRVAWRCYLGMDTVTEDPQ